VDQTSEGCAPSVRSPKLAPYARLAVDPYAYPYADSSRGNAVDKVDDSDSVFPAHDHLVVHSGQPTGGLITRRSQVQILSPLPHEKGPVLRRRFRARSNRLIRTEWSRFNSVYAGSSCSHGLTTAASVSSCSDSSRSSQLAGSTRRSLSGRPGCLVGVDLLVSGHRCPGLPVVHEA